MHSRMHCHMHVQAWDLAYPIEGVGRYTTERLTQCEAAGKKVIYCYRVVKRKECTILVMPDRIIILLTPPRLISANGRLGHGCER
jgi:hypothetical protein